jgi:hypothetical protein
MISNFFTITPSECLLDKMLQVDGNVGNAVKLGIQTYAATEVSIGEDVPAHSAMVQSALHRFRKLIYGRIAYFHSLTRITCSLTMSFPLALLFTTFILPLISCAPSPNFSADGPGLGLGDGSGLDPST